MRCSQPWAAQDLMRARPDWGVVEVVELAFESHDELGLREGAVAEVPFHQGRVEAEVGGGEEPDGAGTLQVAVQLEQVGGRQPRVVVVLLRSSVWNWSDAPT
jgi:hypothetical protein